MIKIYSRPLPGFLLSIALASSAGHATTVQFQTVLGDFEVNLYDQTTPETVENFLVYVNSGAYSNNVMHRSITDFVLQAGGYRFDEALPLELVEENAAVVNEPVYSNIRGTIAMAKLSGDPDSATNEWFFNLADNSANLDVQNEGFTVFGEVMENGMDVIDAIAALPVYNLDNGAFSDTPLRNYSDDDAANGVDLTVDNFVIINAVVVLDPSVDTAADLQPAPNTLIDADNSGDDSGGDSGSSGGGGATGVGVLGLLFGLVFVRRFSGRGRAQC